MAITMKGSILLLKRSTSTNILVRNNSKFLDYLQNLRFAKFQCLFKKYYYLWQSRRTDEHYLRYTRKVLPNIKCETKTFEK